MKDIILYCVSTLFGVLAGVILQVQICGMIHKKPMEALGIEKFQRCEINTTNCHSN